MPIMPNAPSLDVNPQDDNWIPEGFVLVVGPNNVKYIVPEYSLPDLDQEYLSNKNKEELRANNALGSVSFLILFFRLKVLRYPATGIRLQASG